MLLLASRKLVWITLAVCLSHSFIFAQNNCPVDAPDGFSVEESGSDCFIVFIWPKDQMPALDCGSPGSQAAGSSTPAGKLIDMTLNGGTVIYENGNNCSGSTFNFAYHPTLPDTYISTTSHCDIAALSEVSFVSNRTGGSNFTCTQTNNTPSNPLPVSFLSFSAQVRGITSISLSWETAWEENNKHFVIQRSKDGKTFVEIGELPGANYSAEGSVYSFLDQNPAAGENYYRLKQVDFDGDFSYSMIIAVSFKEEGQWKIYPTLFSSSVNVEYTGDRTPVVMILVYDLYGRLVYQHPSQRDQMNHELMLDHLPSGMYSLQVKDGHVEPQSYRIIKP